MKNTTTPRLRELVEEMLALTGKSSPGYPTGTRCEELLAEHRGGGSLYITIDSVRTPIDDEYFVGVQVEVTPPVKEVE